MMLGPLKLARSPAAVLVFARRVRPRDFRLGQMPDAARPKSGTILADLDNALADRAGAREVVEQRVTVAAADRLGQRRHILIEAAEHFQHGFLVGEEDVAPHGRVGGGDAREIAEAAG